MILQIESLSITLTTEDGDERPLVQDVSLSVARGRTTGLLGPSGCGKSLTALAVTGLLPGEMRMSGGSIRLEGRELRVERDFAAARGRRVGMIFQEPRAALNPTRPVGRQLADVIAAHHGLRGAAARREAVSWLERVGIPSPALRAADHPHRFSGGQLQRVLTAIALAGGPALLIADEATSSLDVTVQGRMLGLLRRLQRETGLAVLLITHDRRVVRAVADDVWVMEPGGPTRREGAAS